MPQDRDTGAAGNEYGHETALRVAEKVGASGLGKASNECRIDGKRIVIKCARAGTASVGVTYKMLDRLDGIWELSSSTMGPTISCCLTPAVTGSRCGRRGARAPVRDGSVLSRGVFSSSTVALLAMFGSTDIAPGAV